MLSQKKSNLKLVEWALWAVKYQKWRNFKIPSFNFLLKFWIEGASYSKEIIEGRWSK